jgi:putative membrane protein
MQRARDFFTSEEREKISNAVREAEKQTSGEIVPVVATSSGRYERGEDVGGLLFSLAALIASWLPFQRVLPVHGDWSHGYRLTLELGSLLLIVIVGFMVGVAITSRVAWLRRLLATHREMRREVERAAEEAFVRFRVARTAGGTGILLYVSLFEHMVCVLGDARVSTKLDQEIWNKIHATITDGIRRKRPAEAFCEAIAYCGELLSQHFPHRVGDINKLGNELRIID